MKYNLNDKVKFIKDIENYPATATALIKISKNMIGKTFTIDTIRNDKKYPYGGTIPCWGTISYFNEKELELA